MHLGVFQDYILAVLWFCIDDDIWGARGHQPEQQHRFQAALALKAMLMKWYKEERRRNPGRPLYELGDFSLKTMGSHDKPALVGVKAAESGTLLRFAVSLAEEYRHRLARGGALVAAGRGLVKYLDATRQAPLRLPAAKRQALTDGLVECMANRVSAGVPFKPKLHLCTHIPKDAKSFGDPCATGTWVDEGLNSKLAAVCASARSAVWSERVLGTFAHSAGPTARAAESRGEKQRNA